MRDALHRAYVNARVMSAILCAVCDDYNWADAISQLRQGQKLWSSPLSVLVTHSSLLTSLYVHVYRNRSWRVSLKAIKVDGVFTADPVANPDAELYDIVLQIQQFLRKNLK